MMQIIDLFVKSNILKTKTGRSILCKLCKMINAIMKNYAKGSIFLQTNSVSHIQLKFKKHDNDKLQDHVCIVPDETFTRTKKLFMIPLTVARKDFLVTTIINTLDSGITIKRNQIFAQVSNPSKDINKTLSSTDHSQLSATQETAQDSNPNITLMP